MGYERVMRCITGGMDNAAGDGGSIQTANTCYDFDCTSGI